MMVSTIYQTEGVPAAYPDPPAGLSAAAMALAPAMVWQRLEAWIAHRYSERSIEWIVEGAGEWRPPLAPASITIVERWNGEAWETTTLAPSPVGFELPGVGPYRFTGTVGPASPSVPPAAVLEAYRRLAEYSVAEATSGRAGARTESIMVPDVGTVSYERAPAWMAQALQNSGAADLLRTYRRV